MDLIDRMKSGDKKAIETGLFHTGALYRVNSMIFSVRGNYSTPMMISRMKELRSDDTPLFGTKDSFIVSDFANAALDLLNIMKYHGKRGTVTSLIDAKMVF